MSYARFHGPDSDAPDGSDVYVFLSCYGELECCGCALRRSTHAYRFRTTEEMIGHLDEHRSAGHAVPDYTYASLHDDEVENDEWIARFWANGGEDPDDA